MKKIMAQLLVFLLAATMFAACGKKTGTDTTTPEEPGEQQQGGEQQTDPPAQGQPIAIELMPVYNGEYTDYGWINYSGTMYQNSLVNAEYGVISKGGKLTGYQLIPDMNIPIYSFEDGTGTIILSGTERISTSVFFDVEGTNLNRIRNNVTGYLLGVYTSQEEADKAKGEYAKASDILSGKAAASKPSIIVNGRLRPELTFTVDANGRYWLPFTAILDARGIPWVEDAECILVRDWTGTTTAYPGVNVANLDMSNRYDTKDDEFFSFSAQTWNDNFKRIKEIDGVWYADAEMMSRLLGMKIEVTDNLVVVTTDEKDIPQQFFLFDEDALAYTEIQF